MAFIIQIRRDTAANWTAANPILAQGEMAIELDTNKEKIGNGVTAWNSLAYKTLASADSLYLGFYNTELALTTAHPTALAGNYAVVGATDTVWIWDTDTTDWVDSGNELGIVPPNSVGVIELKDEIKDNILWKDNTEIYTPTTDYHPATKKYVDENAGGGGSEYGTRVDMGVSNVINWINPNEVFVKEMTSNSTFTDTNLPIGINVKKITLYLQGAFTPTFPTYWKKVGTTVYATNSVNRYDIQLVINDGGELLIYYSITAVSFSVPSAYGEPFVWYDLADLETIFISSLVRISSVLDKSGNGYDLSKLDPDPNNSWDNGIVTLNSLNTISFGNTGMITENFGLQNTNTFILVKQNLNVSSTYYLDGIDATNRQVGRIVDFFDEVIDAGTQLKEPTNAGNGTWEINVLVFNGVNSRLIRSNVDTDLTGDAGSNGVEGLTIGCSYDNILGKSGYLAEFIMYNSIISDSEINTVCNYLANKWGLIWTDI